MSPPRLRGYSKAWMRVLSQRRGGGAGKAGWTGQSGWRGTWRGHAILSLVFPRPHDFANSILLKSTTDLPGGETALGCATGLVSADGFYRNGARRSSKFLNPHTVVRLARLARTAFFRSLQFVHKPPFSFSYFFSLLVIDGLLQDEQ